VGGWYYVYWLFREGVVVRWAISGSDSGSCTVGTVPSLLQVSNLWFIPADCLLFFL
jgi:hypothetical protein